jgi:hypothetical protein
VHTAFTFANESRAVTHAPVDPNSVPPGSLIALLQKGLQFLELEANLEGQVRRRLELWLSSHARLRAGVRNLTRLILAALQDGDVGGEFKMLTPDELLTHDVDTLRQLVQERREEATAGRSHADRPAKKERHAPAAKDSNKVRRWCCPMLRCIAKPSGTRAESISRDASPLRTGTTKTKTRRTFKQRQNAACSSLLSSSWHQGTGQHCSGCGGTGRRSCTLRSAR